MYCINTSGTGGKIYHRWQNLPPVSFIQIYSVNLVSYAYVLYYDDCLYGWPEGCYSVNNTFQPSYQTIDQLHDHKTGGRGGGRPLFPPPVTSCSAFGRTQTTCRPEYPAQNQTQEVLGKEQARRSPAKTWIRWFFLHGPTCAALWSSETLRCRWHRWASVFRVIFLEC